MERIVPILDAHCTFPLLEKKKLFERTLFNFLTGNEDMHLKNFSLITRDGRIEFSPAYDFLNSTLALENAQEEIALPLKGKKRKLSRKDLVDYFGRETLGLNERTIEEILQGLGSSFPEWERLLSECFLSDESKATYLSLLGARRKTLGL